MPPPKIEEAPAVYSWLEPIYNSFWRLHRQRRQGFSGMEKLTTSDILIFFETLLPYNNADEFYDYITAMDDTFIRFVREYLKTAPPAPGK